MNRQDFLLKFADVLQTDEELSFETELETLEDWDSLAVMATIAFLEKEFGVKTVMNDYKTLTTINDIALKAGL